MLPYSKTPLYWPTGRQTINAVFREVVGLGSYIIPTIVLYGTIVWTQIKQLIQRRGFTCGVVSYRGFTLYAVRQQVVIQLVVSSYKLPAPPTRPTWEV